MQHWQNNSFDSENKTKNFQKYLSWKLYNSGWGVCVFHCGDGTAIGI